MIATEKINKKANNCQAGWNVCTKKQTTKSKLDQTAIFPNMKILYNNDKCYSKNKSK